MPLLNLALIVTVYLLVRLIPQKSLIAYGLVLAGAVQAVLVVMQQCNLADSSHPFWNATGFFGNPGQMGGFQAVTFVTACMLFKDSRRIGTKNALAIVAIVITCSLLAADSRASALAAICGLVMVYGHELRTAFSKKKWLVLPIAASAICIGAALYFYRCDSADARLLIWRVSTKMIIDKPLTGHGPEGFSMEYMLYQASYFENHPDSVFTMVADNAAYPYNEVIHILVEYGIIGLAVAIALIALSLRNIRKSSSLAAFVTLIVFSMFSYPTYKSGLLVLFPITAGIAGKDLEPSLRKYRSAAMTILIPTIVALAILIERLQLKEREFMFDCYPAVVTEEVIPHLRPTCENWCKIGDYYCRMKDYETAEQYYKTASFMIPTRMRPNYSLWRSYLTQGKEKEAIEFACRIMNQPLKTENTRTLRWRAEAREWLKDRQSEDLHCGRTQ